MKTFKLSVFLVLVTIPFLLISQINHTIQFSSDDISLIDEVASDGNNYTKVSLLDISQVDNVGKPSLPVKYIKLIIPLGQTVDNITLSNISVETFSTNYIVYPAQHPIPTCIGCPTPDFVIPDSEIYNSQYSWPLEPVVVEHQGYFDGSNNIITLAICPFEYSPKTGQLDLFTAIEINITLTSGYSNGITNINRLSKNQIIYDEMLSSLVENTQDIDLYKTSPNIIESITSTGSLLSFEYVIITPADYINSFDDFIDWKKKKGIDIGIVTIEDIKSNYSGDEIFPGDEIYDDAGKIRQYLFEAYQNGTVWALLVGDASVFPIRYGWGSDNSSSGHYIIPTDMYFADLTGNWNVDHDNKWGEPNNDAPDYSPEIFVGRLLCSSAQDVSNWVQKVLIYEKNPGNGDFSYLTESFMFQADQLQEDDEAGQVANHLPMFNHTIWEELPSYNSINPTFPKGADVIAELNTNNYGLMSWFGHGGTGGQNSGVTTLSSGMNGQPYWKLDAEDAYEYHNVVPEDNDGLDNLTNYNSPFVIYSISCDITPFDITKNMNNEGARNCGESFTVNNLGGGIAFLGNTKYGYVTYSANLFKEFCNLITQNTTEPCSSHLGVAELFSKANYTAEQSHYLRYTHNLIGGPETQIWTSTPQLLTADVNPTTAITNITNYFEVTVHNLGEDKQATVCLYKENEIFATQIIEGDANNQAIAIFNNILPISTGEISVTVVSHNYIPFETVIPVEEECTISINSDELWDTDMLISCDVVVEPGVVLTIGSTISLFPETKIIIMPSAKVIINGGTLTNACDEPWQGIQVWGNKTAHQFPDVNGNYQQGYLELKNGVTIENAIIAVDLWEPDNWSSTGGIVHARGGYSEETKVIFRNNTKSIHALNYNNYHPYIPTQEMDYNSNFKYCTFEIIDDYLGTETFHKHVDLAHVKGIDFQGCDFSLADNVTNVSDYTHAIAGYDAKFRVSAVCNSMQSPCPEEDYDKCTFTGFFSAINAVNDGEIPLSFSVNRADFFDNAYGVRTLNMNNASVLFSNFEVGNFNGCGTGIYTDYVTGFAFEENEFSKYAGNPFSNYFGIIINSSEDVNEIYKNEFTGLSYANFSDGKNYGYNYYEGLAYYCNINSNNFADFFVADGDLFNPSGIQLHQGNDDYIAANTFTTNGATWHFYNGGGHQVDYYTNPNNSNATPELVHNVEVMFTEAENTCPSHYGGTPKLELSLTTQQKVDAEQVYYDNLTDYNSTKALYDSYIDGGDTEGEKLDIVTAQPADMWALRAQLLGDSPHLSFEILKEAADKTDVFTESALFDILAANPDELRKDTLISYLENKEDPLPDYMIVLLQQLAGGITYKTALQKQMAGYKQSYYRSANDIIRSIHNDTVTDYVELRNWLNNLGGITSDRQIISTYISEGNFTDAFALANMLPSLYNIDGTELTEHNYYMDMLSLHQTLFQQGRNTFQLDSTEKTNITYIANNSNGIASVQAKSILEAVYNEYCAVCPDVEGTAGYKSNAIINTDVLGKIYGLDIQVKPNPAKQWAAFDYTLPDNENTGSITIRNTSGSIVEIIAVSGKQGQKLWDTRNVISGVYLYTINSAGFSKTGKIVVSK
jgi:hypothetical protein